MALSMGLLGAAGFVPVGSAFDLLETQVLDTAESSVTFSSLSTYAADYQHLQLRYVARDTGSFIDRAIEVRLNEDSGSNYSSHRLGTDGSIFANAYTSRPFMDNLAVMTGASSAAGAFGAGVIDCLDVFSTDKYKTFRAFVGQTSKNILMLNSGLWQSTAAVTSIEFIASGTAFATGSRFSIYGRRV